METKDTKLMAIVRHCVSTEIYSSREVEVARTCGVMIAEVSFKAGIKKAVDYLKMHYCIVAPEEMIKEIEEAK